MGLEVMSVSSSLTVKIRSTYRCEALTMARVMLAWRKGSTPFASGLRLRFVSDTEIASKDEFKMLEALLGHFSDGLRSAMTIFDIFIIAWNANALS